MRIRRLMATAGLGTALALGATVIPAAAAPTVTGSYPSSCSGWTDWYAGHGRGHLNCAGAGRDIRVTVECGGGVAKRSAIGYEYAKAECPRGLGATGLSGRFV
nr:hypothetical protein StreXyl84_66860 [Streptomyces sp. Xyl84]